MTGPLPQRARSVSDGVPPSRVRKHADSPRSLYDHPCWSTSQRAPAGREGMGRTRHVTRLGFFTAISVFFVLTGCQTLHADLSDAEMEAKVRDNFEPGMSYADTEKRLYRMNWIEGIYRTDENDLRATIWPKKFLGLVGGILDYYGREILLFRFGNDDALDEVVFRPGTSSSRKDRGELVINLEENP